MAPVRFEPPFETETEATDSRGRVFQSLREGCVLDARSDLPAGTLCRIAGASRSEDFAARGESPTIMNQLIANMSYDEIILLLYNVKIHNSNT